MTERNVRIKPARTNLTPRQDRGQMQAADITLLGPMIGPPESLRHRRRRVKRGHKLGLAPGPTARIRRHVQRPLPRSQLAHQLFQAVHLRDIGRVDHGGNG
jgi:hypothetical protein